MRAIVRPHDVRVVRADDEPSANRAVGRVRRIARLGSYVKLDVGIPTGRDGRRAHAARASSSEMDLAVGDPVLVDLDNARVFVEDFAI